LYFQHSKDRSQSYEQFNSKIREKNFKVKLKFNPMKGFIALFSIEITHKILLQVNFACRIYASKLAKMGLA